MRNGQIICQAVAKVDIASETECNAIIFVLTAKARHKTARDCLCKGETVWIGRDHTEERGVLDQTVSPCQRDAVDTLAADTNAVQIANANRRNSVIGRAFQTRQRINRWTAINAATVRWVPVEEATSHSPRAVICVAVEFDIVRQLKRRVEEEFEIIIHIRLTPILRHFIREGVDRQEVTRSCITRCD